MMPMKLAAAGIAIAMAFAVTTPPAPAAPVAAPGLTTLLPKSKSYQLAACPQPTLAKCIHVCETKYNGYRCEGWCRERGCK